MTSSERPGLPSRWIRTLPWLAGLLIGASAHIVWWTSTRAPAEPEVRVVTVPSPEVHVVLHGDRVEGPVVVRVEQGSCDRERKRERAASRARRRSAAGASGVVVCGDGGCRIRRSFLTSVLHEPTLLGHPTRVREIRERQGVEGLQIRGVFPGSLPDLLGLRSGDTILSIDGLPTRTTAELAAVARALDRVGAFTMTVDRHGIRHTLRHWVI